MNGTWPEPHGDANWWHGKQSHVHCLTWLQSDRMQRAIVWMRLSAIDSADGNLLSLSQQSSLRLHSEVVLGKLQKKKSKSNPNICIVSIEWCHYFLWVDYWIDQLLVLLPTKSKVCLPYNDHHISSWTLGRRGKEPEAARASSIYTATDMTRCPSKTTKPSPWISRWGAGSTQHIQNMIH